MARKLNWTKARSDTIKSELISSQLHESNANSDKYFKFKANVTTQHKLLEEGIWPTGKHTGTKISKLSEKYLVWAGLNLKSKHIKYAANKELLRRYHSGEIKL